MLRTRKRHTDKTVILKPGDHPFVKHESSVHYSDANFMRVDRIYDAVENGHITPRENMSPELLKRLRKGILKSAHTPHSVKDYCKERFKAEKK